jgi:PAS domain S-box-containing protein
MSAALEAGVPSPEEVAPGASELDVAGPALLAAIVASSDDAIVCKTLNGEVCSWNAAATRIFGYEPAEIIGRSITTIIPPELQNEEVEILSKVRRGERVDHFETIRITKDGRRIPISLTVSPVRDAQGNIIAASKVARDISERRRAEALLREADRRKDEFLALLAHELRNPLAPIRYALELTKRAGSSEPQRHEARQIIERQVTQLARLLDDLLDVSRISRGRVELRKQPLKLQGVVAVALETVRPLITARHHRLTVNMPEAPVHLEGDSVRLVQVLSNLLTNAAKFTAPGGNIELAAITAADKVRVTVRDDGIGIAPEMRPRLFTMFAQDRSRSQEGGLGVGLCLVRELVALHGGAVEAESGGEGCGSTFSITLPIIARADGTASRALVQWDAAAGLRVLVVDDNRDATDSCQALLALNGCHVEGAYSARRALDLAEKLRPQVVLLDIGLPDLNGYEVARLIRGRDWGVGAVLVAISGWGLAQDRRRATEAGFDWHLTKPVDPEDLRSFLRSIAQGNRQEESPFGRRLSAPPLSF